MVSVSQLTRIEGTLRQGQTGGGNGKICKEYVGKLRRELASGVSSAEVRRKLEQLISRFGSVRY